MPNFGGGEFKTTDGVDVASEQPHGAMIVVYRDIGSRLEVLLLHRVGLPETGDWTWTPPSGARFPDEKPSVCAERELHEETGIVAEVIPVIVENVDWALYATQVESGIALQLNEEHDRFDWVSASEAIERCLPTVVRDGLSFVLDSLKYCD